MQQRLRTLDARTAYWLAAALATLHALAYGARFEDAFITYRYAENLVAGHGFAFNPGERVDGFTSMSWTLLLALGHALGASLPWLAPVLSMLAMLLLLGAHGQLVLGLLPSVAPLATRAQVVLLSSLMLACSPTLAFYAPSGMETVAFAWLVQLAWLAALRTTPRSAYVCGVLLAIATATRPEGFGYAAVLVIALGLAPRARADAVRVLASYGACIAPYQLWRTQYFGYALPNTYYAKVETSGAVLHAGVLRFLDHALTDGFWVVPFVLYALLRREGWSRRSLLLSGLLLAGPANLIAVGGDTFVMARFLLPSLPALSALLVLALLKAHPDPSATPNDIGVSVTPRATLAALGLALVAALAPQLPPPGFSPQQAITTRVVLDEIDRLDRDYVRIGQWLHAHAPPDTHIAINAAGIIPYFSALPTIDMLGLNDVHIAHLRIALGSGLHGHEKHDAAYVVGRKPQLVLPGLPALMSRCPSMKELATFYGRTAGALPGDKELFALPAFKKQYLPGCFQIARDACFTMFVHRDFRALRE